MNSELKISIARIKVPANNIGVGNKAVYWNRNISSFYELDDLDEELIDYMESIYIMKYKLIDKHTTSSFSGLIYR